MTNRSRVAAGLLASAAAATILVGCGSSGDTASTSAAASSTATTGTSTGTANTSELRDSRYCEIIPVTRDGKTLTSSVYNTTGPVVAARQFSNQTAGGNGFPWFTNFKI